MEWIVSDGKQIVLITVEIEQRNDWCKLRRWLKCILRTYGLKCISVEPAKDEGASNDQQH